MKVNPNSLEGLSIQIGTPSVGRREQVFADLVSRYDEVRWCMAPKLRDLDFKPKIKACQKQPSHSRPSNRLIRLDRTGIVTKISRLMSGFWHEALPGRQRTALWRQRLYGAQRQPPRVTAYKLV